MTTPQEERSETPTLLLMISDIAEPDASVRSGHRQVRRWSPSQTPRGDSEFCGDPTVPETYAWVCDARAVTAVVQLKDDDRATGAVAALRSIRPDSALLVLTEAVDHAPGDGTLSRAGSLRDVLRLDLEDELVRLEAERRAWCLHGFADGCEIVAILIHPDPDPDALSSALAVQTLLGRDDATAPILSAGRAIRPENRRMADVLDMRIHEIEMTDLQKYERVIVVDMQPANVGGDVPRLAVIDHHPPESHYHADVIDVRPEYGAVATMLTEYLRAQDADLIDPRLATALLHGIRTDTDLLTRGVTPADVNAYAFLQTRADRSLLRRIEKPVMPVGAARTFGRAVETIRIEGDVIAYAYAGKLSDEEKHILAEIADFCMTIENVTRAVVGGVNADKLILTLRDLGQGAGVGELARVIGANGGNGGGHATMARAVIQLTSLENWGEGKELECIIELIGNAAESLR